MPLDEKTNTKSVAVIRHHRSIRRFRPWLVGLVTLGLLGIAAALTLLIVHAIQSSDGFSVEQAELDLINQELVDAAKAEAEKSAKLALGPEVSRSTVVDGGPREKIIPIPQPPSKIIRSGQLDDCWMRVRPFIVKLTAQTPLGPKSLTGTIIDSRGWVATSYRAIQGAGEIEVSQSPKTSDDLNSSSLLTDKVRGVIATDLEHDLAILSVNRRFVVSFSDLPMIEQDNLVISEYLVQCVAPTDEYPWSATECRIDNRIRLSECPDQLGASLRRAQLSDPGTNWIIHKNNSPLRVGAPLFSPDGPLVAINVSAAAGPDAVLAVPVEYLKQLLTGAVDQPEPLPVPVLDLAVSNGNGSPPATEATMPVLPLASPNRSLSVMLNQAGSECEANGWWPKTEHDVPPLVQFATQLLLAHDLLSGESAQANESDNETISRQITYWTDKLRLNLRPEGMLTADEKLAFNQLMNDRLGGSAQPLIAMADVHFSAMESPSVAIDQKTREDSVTFQITGTRTHVITNLDAQWPPLRPDSPWVIVGRTLGKKVKIVSGDEVESAELAKIRFVIPVAKEP